MDLQSILRRKRLSEQAEDALIVLNSQRVMLNQEERAALDTLVRWSERTKAQLEHDYERTEPVTLPPTQARDLVQ